MLWNVRFIVKLLIALLLMLPLVELRATPTEPNALGVRIAISTFTYLADSETLDFDHKRRSYLPAGTRFVIYDKVHRYQGADWRLILTENGLWNYIKSTEKSENYFRPDTRQIFIDNEKVAMVRRSGTIELNISQDVLVRVKLTRSEVYKYLRETEKGIVVEMTKLKLGPDVNVEAVIPYKDHMVVIIDKKKPLKRSDIKPFQIKSYQGVFGIRKQCGVQQIGKLGSGAGASFDFDLWFVKAKVGGDASIEKSEILGSNVSIVRTYYGRDGEPGSYQVSEIMQCDNQRFSYRYVNPRTREITFNSSLGDRGFALDEETNRVLITKPQEYFKLYDILVKRGFERFEIPFLISKLATIVRD